MRLKLIKLAGFKSFVDPTTVPWPKNLSAIVGPNGCGKSNIIDAVRWVMGESSAKNLRGDAMTDVIFNGSTARKPVGQASVELVFDNSDGQLAGEYASYSELSIRRTVTRDAQSTYYLNGTRCRRKDITDIFLGTGLGARSYAIIEQGMISRLIESKPQELRIFIEEAAGISKYKERRRETETRIRHTRENLDRLGDVREELGKQLSHLHRQAQSAEKFKAYKHDERTLKVQLAAIRWRDLNQQIGTLEQQIRQFATEYEARAAEHQSADTGIEQHRQQHIELTDKFNQVQGHFYGIGADIARLEQGLQHRVERKQQLNADLGRAQQLSQNAHQHHSVDAARIEQLNEEIQQLEPDVEQARAEADESAQRRNDVDATIQHWQQQWDEFNQSASANTQKTEVEKTRIQHIESALQRQVCRREELSAERDALLKLMDASELEQLAAQLDVLEQETAQHQAQSQSVKAALDAERLNQDQQHNALHREQQQLQHVRGQQVSLAALQQAVLGGADGKATLTWLEGQGVVGATRLANELEVEPGWETAVEVVLGDTLQAIVSDPDEFAALCRAATTLEQGSITLVEREANRLSETDALAGTTPLRDKVRSTAGEPWPLAGVFTCASLERGLVLRTALQPGQSLVTPDGILIGPNWLKVAHSQDTRAGFLARKTQLEEVDSALQLQQENVTEREQRLAESRQRLTQLESAWEQAQGQQVEVNRQRAEKRGQLDTLKSHLQNMTQRLERLQVDGAELEQQQVQEQQRLTQARAVLEGALEAMAGDAEQRELLLAERDERRNSMAQIRDQAREYKDRVHILDLRFESLRTELASKRASQERASEQVSELRQRQENLRIAMAENEQPVATMQAELEQALAARLDVEEELKRARERLDQCEQGLRQLEKQRLSSEQALDAVRHKLETEKMRWQGLSVQRDNQQQHIEQSDETVESVVVLLPQDANEEHWGQEIARLAVRIERLGAINLAAIEEFDAQTERKNYLDVQDTDLRQALETLESAIRKIDRETRTKFKDTFDRLNKGLQELFPKVFGGGHAYLELSGEDLLDTGVSIMARPPGKRNSTIHLLSGGEKALTAIALVFAIFRLNPAPFCMLDEVDAPLDDANVGRFCRLVEEMSKTIQFIYISHNKQAMEMAQALVGVTMQEPGVSRMVSVDIGEAAALAAS